MRKYLLCCVFCLMSAMFCIGCKADEVETDEEIRIPNEEDEETLGEAAALYEAVKNENLEDLGEIATSEDGVYQVLIPSGWKVCENKIDEMTLFEIQGGTADQYIGILVLDKADYEQFDSAVYMEAYAQNAKNEYKSVVISDVTEEKLNGIPVYSLQIAGKVDGSMYVNLVYGVDYESEMVVFTASTSVDNASEVVSDLHDVVVSFGRRESELPSENIIDFIEGIIEE